MQPIQLSDALYLRAQQRATAAGFQSVDDYVAEIVASDISACSENFDHLFTPELVAQLDHIQAEAQAGASTFSPEDVNAHFRRKSEAWHRTRLAGSTVG